MAIVFLSVDTLLSQVKTSALGMVVVVAKGLNIRRQMGVRFTNTTIVTEIVEMRDERRKKLS